MSEVTTDKKVMKKILQEGEGYERPNDGAVVQGEDGLKNTIINCVSLGSTVHSFLP